jgi:hypothetical protein
MAPGITVNREVGRGGDVVELEDPVPNELETSAEDIA